MPSVPRYQRGFGGASAEVSGSWSGEAGPAIYGGFAACAAFGLAEFLGAAVLAAALAVVLTGCGDAPAGGVATHEAALTPQPTWGYEITFAGGTSEDPEAFTRFGREVAVSGPRVAVGDPLTGEVHIYRRGEARASVFYWLREAVVTKPPNDPDQFGASVALSGERLAVGAPKNSGDTEGYVNVYRWSGGAWALEQRVEPAAYPPTNHPNAALEANFGRRVALDGDVLVVGANRWSGGDGAAFIYERIDGAWTDVASLSEATLTNLDENFGHQVAVSGDRVAISMPGKGGAPPVDGAVFVYRRDPSLGWVLEARLQTPSSGMPVTRDYFGGGLDLEGDTLVAASQGETWIFRRGDAGWSIVHSAPNDGGPVAYSAGTMATYQYGLVQLYEEDASGAWVHTMAIWPPQVIMNEFGAAFALDEGLLAVGQPGLGQSHVYVRGGGGDAIIATE